MIAERFLRYQENSDACNDYCHPIDSMAGWFLWLGQKRPLARPRRHVGRRESYPCIAGDCRDPLGPQVAGHNIKLQTAFKAVCDFI